MFSKIKIRIHNPISVIFHCIEAGGMTGALCTIWKRCFMLVTNGPLFNPEFSWAWTVVLAKSKAKSLPFDWDAVIQSVYNFVAL